MMSNDELIEDVLKVWQARDKLMESMPEGWKLELINPADEMLSLSQKALSCIKYIQGIAERGQGRPIRDDESVESFVLDYVKKIEKERDELAAKLADIEKQEPAAYLHRMEKTIELSFFGESAECTGRKDWIGFVPLITRANTRFPSSMLNAQPAAVPDGWQLVPKQMTEAMLAAAKTCNIGGAAAEYRAMLAAAPQPSKE